MPISERPSSAFTPAAPDPPAQVREKLIVALDVPDAKSAARLLGQLEGTCSWFKVGLELFTAAGPGIVETIVARGHSVFLDLKLHDIPNTVAGAVRSATSLGVRMLSLHAFGGPAMLTAARAALECVPHPLELLGVTVLTSFDAAELNTVGIMRTPGEQVSLLAQVGLGAGIRGFVCSPNEVANLRAITGHSGVLVVPGIRPSGAAVGDQKRVASPADALQNGASYLVVGRPITQAHDPARAAQAILEEMVASKLS